MENNRLLISVGSNTFVATLQNNPTVKAFQALLPLTITMAELNGNEKYADLPKSIITDASATGQIQTGDLMLYGSRTLVLFYKSFFTSYSYTRLGRIEVTAELASALGPGDVTVSFGKL